MAEPLDRLTAALADRYRIERELGAGGMATVYLAEDVKHHRQVAVKVLRPDLAATLGPERFLREITIAAGLTHPHILSVHDSGEAGGFLFYVMPFVDGISLRQKLVREGELPLPDAARILRDIADAMGYAHQHGVVHRDLKPENVMLAGRHALVTDFGVAKAVNEASAGRSTLTSAGVALGTPAYMAPEQAAADPHTDHRADIYAFGVIAYELLAGRPPFTYATAQQILSAHVVEVPDPITRHRPKIPPALAALVMRCLEKRPADRWQSAEEIVPQLELVLTPSGGMTPTSTQPHPGVRTTAASPVAPRRWGLLLGVAATVAVIVAGVWYWVTKPVPIVPGRVAVLPLENKTGDAALTDRGVRLAEAMTEAIGREGVGEPVAAATIGALTASGGDQAALARRASERTGADLIVRGTYHKAAAGVEIGVEVLRMPAMTQRFAFTATGRSGSDSLVQAVVERTLVALALEKEWGPGVSWQGEYLPKSMKTVREYLRAASQRDTTWYAAAHAAYLADSAWVYPFVLFECCAELERSGYKRGFAAALARLAAFEHRADLTQGDRERLTERRATIDWLLRGDSEEFYQAVKALFARRPTEVAGELLWAAGHTQRYQEVVELRKVLDEPGFFTAAPFRQSMGWAYGGAAWSLHLLGRYREQAEVAREIRQKFPDEAYTAVNMQVQAAVGLGDTTAVKRLVDEYERSLPSDSNRWFSRAIPAAMELAAHGYPDQANAMYERAVRSYDQRLATGDTAVGEVGELALSLQALGQDERLAHLLPSLLARGDSEDFYALTAALAAKRGDRTAVAREDARLARKLARLLARPPGSQEGKGEVWYARAALAALSGNQSRAMDFLGEARKQGYFNDGDLHKAPAFASLRGTPAFEEFIKPRE